jgi:hypothetical protein
VLNKGIARAYIKPASPHLNGKAERAHRIDAEELYRMLTSAIIIDTGVVNDTDARRIRCGVPGPRPAVQQDGALLHRGGDGAVSAGSGYRTMPRGARTAPWHAGACLGYRGGGFAADVGRRMSLAETCGVLLQPLPRCGGKVTVLFPAWNLTGGPDTVGGPTLWAPQVGPAAGCSGLLVRTGEGRRAHPRAPSVPAFDLRLRVTTSCASAYDGAQSETDVTSEVL